MFLANIKPWLLHLNGAVVFWPGYFRHPMNDEGLIFVGQALDWKGDRYGCQRIVRIEERLEERKGRPWREMCTDGSEQVGE